MIEKVYKEVKSNEQIIQRDIQDLINKRVTQIQEKIEVLKKKPKPVVQRIHIKTKQTLRVPQ